MKWGYKPNWGKMEELKTEQKDGAGEIKSTEWIEEEYPNKSCSTG
jgi:hypothetical protein